MSVYEMAWNYYPRLWPVERIETLYKVGKLTKEEYDAIISKPLEQRKEEMRNGN